MAGRLMSTFEGEPAGAPGSAAPIGALPPGGGRWERLKLGVLAVACLAPLGLVILHLGVGAMSGVDEPVDAWPLAAGVVGVGLVSAQVATLLWARSALHGDSVDIAVTVRAKKIMTLLGAMPLIAAPLTAVGGVALVGLSGILTALMFGAIGVLGLLARYRLQKVETIVTRGGGSDSGWAPHPGQPPTAAAPRRRAPDHPS